MMDALDLLGGAVRKKTRTRGFKDWTPRDDTRVILENIHHVLAEYAEHLPLTGRQIFYRLVATFAFPKTERDYKRVLEVVNKARRARLISMDSIRDDGIQRLEPQWFTSPRDFLEAVGRAARAFRLDRQLGQKRRLVVFCEAAGMAPQLARVCDAYGIAVLSSGGFDSTTARYALAREIAGYGQAAEVLHVGDHDPSGAHLFLALGEDVEAFCRSIGGDVLFSRLAVIPEQIDRLHLPTAPTKETDRRAFTGETCQAEAIPPNELARILRQAIEHRLDRDAYETALALERDDRRRLAEQVEMLGWED